MAAPVTAAELGSNPKDLLGIKKVSISKLPVVGIIAGSHAMMYGADKYGPYNWRGNKVIASIYYDAIMRHLMAWFDSKEEVAADSGVYHLGHIIANASIILDAQATGNLIDDRPANGLGSMYLDITNRAIREKSNGEDRNRR
jgi:hypothetical protein